MALSDEAVKLHAQGFNCAQCVLMMSGKYTRLEEDTAKKIAALARNCVDAFREQFGCVRCAELKPAVSCDELISFGAAHVENYTKNKK